MKKILTATLLGIFTLVGLSYNQADAAIYTGVPEADDTYYRPFKKEIKQFSHEMKSTSVKYGDIWIRDVAPVVTSKMVKFRYQPDYLAKSDSQEIEQSFVQWLDQKGFNYIKSDIILDGGNFIFNGSDTAIITKRILKDNPQYSKTQLIDKLKKLLNLKTVVLINEEPGDVLGHADGQVHFIQPHTLFVGEFEGSRTVKKQIKAALPNVKLIDLPSNYQEKGQYDPDIPSAKGLYINMMETKKDIYIPQYGLKSDAKVVKIISRYTNKKVHKINVAKLSTLGGSVNCLTWYCPQNFMPKNDYNQK